MEDLCRSMIKVCGKDQTHLPVVPSASTEIFTEVNDRIMCFTV
ncbi:hypothetical protein Pr1d_33140 [Bythopirellula goksoeyrii]|uniref:Uncharacterized protein n=1 Tax=Bythopirellula goksoeyrii TaxID=1400387 RepID=A0A5B9QEI5_9BACT|nr:hypothetical protein Pr1d_33140 [Bythopirellula goksoeyrii]